MDQVERIGVRSSPNRRSSPSDGYGRIRYLVPSSGECGFGHSLAKMPFRTAVEEDGKLWCIDHCSPRHAEQMREWLALNKVDAERRRQAEERSRTSEVGPPVFGAPGYKALGSSKARV